MMRFVAAPDRGRELARPSGCRRELPSLSDSSTRSLVEAAILRL